MSKQRGYFVEWTTINGARQKGQVFYEDQKPEFKNFKKLFVRLVNDDYTPRLGQGGKKEVGFKNFTNCIIIGYFD